MSKNDKTLVIFLLVIFILFLYHFNHPLINDEGKLLSEAGAMIDGRVIYRDFFEFAPPATHYLIYFLWSVTGPSYLAAKTLFIILLFFCAFGLYKISQKFAAGKTTYLPPLLFAVATWAWPAINYYTLNLFFSIWSVYFFLGFLDRPGSGRRHLALSGLLAGLAMLANQSHGFVLAFALLVWLIYLAIREIDFRKNQAPLVFFAAAFLPLAILLLKWPFGLLWQQLIIFPLFDYSEVARTSYSLLLILFFIFLNTAWLFRKERDRKLQGLLFLQLLMLLSVIPLADRYHLLLSIFPLFCLCPLIIQKLKTRRTLVRRYGLSLAAGFIVFFYLPIFYYLIFNFTPFAMIDNNPLLTFIKDNCTANDYLWAGPFVPGMYFETGKRNPTSYYYLITDHNTPEQFDQANRQLTANPPACAVLNYPGVAKYGYQKDNPVDNFINSRYSFLKRFDNFEVYRIND